CIVVAVGPEGGDLVAEEPRGLRGGVREAGFRHGEVEVELLAQEPPELPRDRFGLVPRPTKPQQEIVSIPQIVESAVAGILRVDRRKALQVLAALARLRVLAPA